MGSVVAGAVGSGLARGQASGGSDNRLFTIALSQWGFHRAIFGDARSDYNWFIKTLHSEPDSVLKGTMDPRDIVVRARELGVDVVDLVNILWFGRGNDSLWLREFQRRADGEDVRFGGLMCDELGKIGASNRSERNVAVKNHIRWMDTAQRLGCSYLRANPYGDGNYLEQCQRCAESLARLGDASKAFGLEILVENHGHPGSNGAWLAMLMEMTDHPRVGVLADFDNFFMGGWGLDPERRYDRHQGMLDLAPYTRAVSAKSHAFAPDGSETTIDYFQCMQTVLDAGFNGLVGAEYEGDGLSEAEGNRLTVALLESTRAKLLDAGYE